MEIGISGEVRCVKKSSDGKVLEDTGYQKNIVLDQGLEYFGGSKGVNIFSYCIIGAGNSQPLETQTQLDNHLAAVSGVPYSNKKDYASDGSGLYKINQVYKYVFNDLNNVNISEIGLASSYSSATSYWLCTRALIKNIDGVPSTITVRTGETLEVYYKVWKVISVVDTAHVINMLDGNGGSVSYNAITRPAFVGVSDKNEVGGTSSIKPYAIGLYSGTLGAVTSNPSGHLGDFFNYETAPYTPNSYKRKITFSLKVGEANSGIRCAMPFYNFMNVQVRYGSAANDSPIPKDATKTLSIPMEFSWGRYEGAL